MEATLFYVMLVMVKVKRFVTFAMAMEHAGEMIVLMVFVHTTKTAVLVSMEELSIQSHGNRLNVPDVMESDEL